MSALISMAETKFSKIEEMLARNIVFGTLSDARRHTIAESATVIPLTKGQSLFRFGDATDAAYAIVAGEVEITIPGLDGREVWIARLGQGSVVGEMGVLDGSPRSTNATASRKTELLKIERKVVTDALVAEPNAALALLGVMARRLRDTDALVERTSPMQLSKRLARFLLVEAIGGKIIYNQSEIAHHIGATREAVNRKLESWRRDNWIEITRTGLHIRDRAALLALCKRSNKLHL